MRRVFLAVVLMLPLSFAAGCAQLAGSVEAVATANDSVLEAGEIVVCKGSSVGAVVRRYWSTQELADAWWDLCYPRPAAPTS